MSSGGGSRLVLAAMIFAVAMTFIDQTIVALAVPELQKDLGLSATGTQWIVNAYLLSLSALFVMMKAAKVPDNVYTRNVVIVVLGMGYSVFALYASGKDAVMGGMLVLGIVYIVWGFIANRFTGELEGSPAPAAKV